MPQSKKTTAQEYYDEEDDIFETPTSRVVDLKQRPREIETEEVDVLIKQGKSISDYSIGDIAIPNYKQYFEA